MPCKGPDPISTTELYWQQTFMLLVEARTSIPVDKGPYARSFKRGYDGGGETPHEIAFRSRKDFDEATAELCAYCNSHDVSKHSLEMQIWWREHQIDDARRADLAKQKRDENERQERAELARLKTKYEA